MRRRKRNTILRIALGLAIAAIVPATALAKPVPVNQDVENHGQYQLGPGEIPYVSQDRQAMELGLSEGKIKALGLLPKQDLENHGQYQLGPGEIPYVSQDRQAMELGLSEGKIKALGLSDEGTVVKSSDDRAVSRATPHGVEVSSAVTSPDDRSFSRATSVDPTPVVVSDDGRSIDFDPYTVTGFVLALLLAMGIGMGIAIWHSRRTKLSPA
jgi:hypothetical protein